MRNAAIASKLLFEAKYRNRTETDVARQLTAAGVDFDYESAKLPYVVPERTHTYLLDFAPRGTNIILEVKGWFGRNGAKERQKYILVREAHPELDIRFVFTDASKKLYKGSKTTYAKWADDNGFKWCDKATIPATWLRELKGTKHGKKKRS